MVEIRCPVHPSKMFLKIGQAHITDGNLIEVACRDCRDTLRQEGNVNVRQVLHRFDVLGTLIESEIVEA